MGLPTISVVFKKLAESASARSSRGILAVILQDATNTTFQTKTYSSAESINASDYTAENYAALCLAFLALPVSVVAVRVGTADTIDKATDILDTLTYNWVCAIPTGYQAGLVTYVKAANTASRVRKIKALVSGQTLINDIHIVNVPNTNVTYAGSSSVTAINLYLPRLAAVLAACPLTESVTYFALEDLSAASSIPDADASVDAGNLVIFKDDDTVRIARGVNTLTTVSGNLTEDMKKITVVEGMDLLMEDIIKTFKTRYLGKMKNDADNQALFISAVSEYYRTLEGEGVLDADADNTVGVDVTAQKAAWTAAGTDTSDWSDAQTKKKTYKSNVYLSSTVRFLDAMEDMTFVVGM